MNTENTTHTYTISEIRHLTKDTFVLRFSRNGMDFRPGQHISMGFKNENNMREYSVYNSPNDNQLEVLIKEVDEGIVSKKLKQVKVGDVVAVKGPYGKFMKQAEAKESKKFLFIASGTGISPFHSFIMANPEIDYRLLHGIRNEAEAYDKSDYSLNAYISCTSRNESGTFFGRITDYLLENDLDPNTDVYLCGNSNMILDSIDILTAKGFSQRQIFTEMYF